MVRIHLLNKRRDILNPAGHHRGVTRLRSGEVSDTVGTAARLVGELPGHDGGGGLVARDEGLDVVFVGGDDARDVVEVVVVLAAEVGGRDVHTAVVGPVVGEGDDELDAELFGGADDAVECLEAGGAVVCGWWVLVSTVHVSITYMDLYIYGVGYIWVRVGTY